MNIHKLRSLLRALLPNALRPYKVISGPLRGLRVYSNLASDTQVVRGKYERPVLEWLTENVSIGDTWKAFVKWRCCKEISSCCIDSDWGLGVISREHSLGASLSSFSEFYDYDQLQRDRVETLNLVAFDEFQRRLRGS